ncbi:RNA polymerase sigma factor [Pseudokineococcus sp. 1T1Z-3]|uniref:RNA polymerase sigma factor n=1 Tax=Pseudokineococcus sp. 1T1Z-3 TaxID=3132745 RepID=UPI0030982F8A
MSTPRSTPEREQAFRAVHAATSADLERFVRRRAGPDAVDDVVADTYLVVWRRLEEVPRAPDDARAWTFGVARHVLLTRQRADGRREALGVRLAATGVPAPGETSDAEADAAARRVDVGRAWHLLSDVHQEALSLSVFEGLDAPRAAAVLGVSPVAYRLRLSRARRALRLHLDHPPQPRPVRAGHPDRSPT